MILTQEKLNVKGKVRSNVFNWRGQFTPQFVEYILDSYTKTNDIIVDPFSGSGTVLHEAIKKDINCFGYEINPAAYLMSKFFSFANISVNERENLINSLHKKLEQLYNEFNILPLYIEKEEYRESYINFINYSTKLNELIKDKKERIIALNMLFIAESFKNIELNKAINKSFIYVKNLLLSIPFTNYNIDARLKDAREINKDFDNTVDVILTSPPYINVFNYHQNHRAIIELFGFDILKVAESEFGSNRKHRGNRFKTVIQYCLDMECAIKSFWDSLKVNGILILIIGRESNVRKTPFFNGRIITDLLKEMNGFSDINLSERSFLNKFGIEIKEDIIMVKKTDVRPSLSHARTIAEHHLEGNLELSRDDIRKDLEEALKTINEVKPSPILNTKSIIKL